MTKLHGVVLALLPVASFAGPIEDACTALEKQAVANAFPRRARGVVQGSRSRLQIARREEVRRQHRVHRATQCTPEVVFWDCQPAPKEKAAAQVLRFDGCAAKGGQWVTRPSVAFGECVVPTGTVQGRVVNAGPDVMLRIEGMEMPGLLQGGAFSLELDANEPTKLELVDRKTGKSVTKTVTVKPRERVVVELTFPK